jgi:hypothetical protein
MTLELRLPLDTRCGQLSRPGRAVGPGELRRSGSPVRPVRSCRRRVVRRARAGRNVARRHDRRQPASYPRPAALRRLAIRLRTKACIPVMDAVAAALARLSLPTSLDSSALRSAFLVRLSRASNTRSSFVVFMICAPVESSSFRYPAPRVSDFRLLTSAFAAMRSVPLRGCLPSDFCLLTSRERPAAPAARRRRAARCGCGSDAAARRSFWSRRTASPSPSRPR